MRKVNKAFVDVHPCPTLCNPIDTGLPSFTISQNLLKLMCIESVMPSNHLILCRPPFLLPSIFPSIRVFSNESAVCIRCPSCWSFSFSLNPSSEYSGLISFRIEWFDLLVVYKALFSTKKTLCFYCLYFSYVPLTTTTKEKTNKNRKFKKKIKTKTNKISMINMIPC